MERRRKIVKKRREISVKTETDSSTWNIFKLKYLSATTWTAVINSHWWHRQKSFLGRKTKYLDYLPDIKTVFSYHALFIKKNKANPNPSKTKQTKNSRSERSHTEQQHLIKKNTQVWPTHRKKNKRKTEEWCMKDWLPYTDQPHRKTKGLQLEWPRR